MEATEFESDALLKLLTDAIRRGPGSPEWHDAVQRLRSSGAQSSDEYRLLMDVRDRLESGKNFREVKAGPEFTRSVFSNLDQPVRARRPIFTFIISFISLIFLVGSVAMLLKMMSSSVSNDQSIELLSNKLFTTISQSWTFGGGSVPDGLKPSGPLKNNFALRLDVDQASKDKTTGGVEAVDAVQLENGACIESVVYYRPGNNIQMHLSLAGGGKTFELLLDDAGFDVNSAGDHTQIKKSLPGGEYAIRIKINTVSAIIEIDGQPVWSGAHQLPGAAKLSVTLNRLGESAGDIRVQSLKILTP